MAKRIVQICSAPPNVKIAYYNSGEVDLYSPTCMAFVERGTDQAIVYMETVDNEVKEVDTEAKDFMGFVDDSDLGALKDLQYAAEERLSKESGKSK
jgi:hypothetical protein